MAAKSTDKNTGTKSVKREAAKKPKAPSKASTPKTGSKKAIVKSDAPIEDASIPKTASTDAISMDALKGYIKKIYEATHGSSVTDFNTVVKSMPPQAINYFESNAGLIDQVVAAKDEQDLDELLGLLDGKSPQIQQSEASTGAKTDVDPDAIQVVMQFYGWLQITAETGKQIASDMKTGYVLGSNKMPIRIDTGGDGELASIRFSLLGGRGFEGNGNDQEKPSQEEVSIGFDGLSRDAMQLCFDVLQIAEKAQFGAFQITGGQYEVRRNIWALAKVNDVSCTGFTPSQKDEQPRRKTY